MDGAGLPIVPVMMGSWYQNQNLLSLPTRLSFYCDIFRIIAIYLNLLFIYLNSREWQEASDVDPAWLHALKTSAERDELWRKEKCLMWQLRATRMVLPSPHLDPELSLSARFVRSSSWGSRMRGRFLKAYSSSRSHQWAAKWERYRAKIKRNKYQTRQKKHSTVYRFTHKRTTCLQ